MGIFSHFSMTKHLTFLNQPYWRSNHDHDFRCKPTVSSFFSAASSESLSLVAVESNSSRFRVFCSSCCRSCLVESSSFPSRSRSVVTSWTQAHHM